MIGVAARDIGHPAFHRRPILFDRFGIAVTLPELPRQDDPRLAPARRHHIGEGLRLRSEEHTSELQSLMRISYDVFCSQNTHNTTSRSQQRSSYSKQTSSDRRR